MDKRFLEALAELCTDHNILINKVSADRTTMSFSPIDMEELTFYGVDLETFRLVKSEGSLPFSLYAKVSYMKHEVISINSLRYLETLDEAKSLLSTIASNAGSLKNLDATASEVPYVK